MTIKEYAWREGVSEKTVYTWIKQGQLTATKIGQSWDIEQSEEVKSDSTESAIKDGDWLLWEDGHFWNMGNKKESILTEIKVLEQSLDAWEELLDNYGRALAEIETLRAEMNKQKSEE